MLYLGGLCFITNSSLCKLSYEDMVLRALKAGVRWIQYRDKERSRREVYEESVRLRSIAEDFDAVFIINDYPDIALAVNADGVHLGQDDLPLREARSIMGKDKIIGVSTHSLNQAVEADKNGADYIGLGPVFHTKTKNAGRPRGTDMLREVKGHVHIPVVAIGGVNFKNISSVLEAGADAVAVASAILCGDIEDNTRRFMKIIESFKVK